MIHQEWDTKPHDMKQKLIGRISMDNIHELCFLTQGEENNHRKEELYRLTFDEDNRVAFNALHVLSNFDLANNEWLYCKHDELIDRVMKEEHVGKRRLMLNLLLRQPFEEEFLRSDFIDFCVSKIADLRSTSRSPVSMSVCSPFIASPFHSRSHRACSQ